MVSLVILNFLVILSVAKNPLGDPSASPQDDGQVPCHSDPEQDSRHSDGPLAQKNPIHVKIKLMSLKQGFVYILTNKYNTVFYTGITSNLQKRIWEHKNNIVKGFTQKYNIHKLIYYEVFENIEEAIVREKYIKGKKREYKKGLIEKMNPQYKDLYEDIL